MNNYKGCIDNQNVAEKAKNYKFAEICSSISPVEWLEKTDWISYTPRNQNGSLTCVVQTYATEMGIIAKQKYGEWIDFSASFPYQQKESIAYGGCSSTDIYKIFPKLGNIMEVIMPSQNMHEAEVLAVPRKKYYDDLAMPFKIPRIELPVDFESLCSTLQVTGKGIMIWFHIGAGEWGLEPVFLNNGISSNHSVTLVDFGLRNGKKYMRILDSVDGVYRWISEEYFNARCFLASYLLVFKKLIVTEDTPKPKFDGSIISLQTCLEYEGLFPTNIPKFENYGNITKKAVIDFQKKYNITPAVGFFGPITRAKISSLYN